MLTVVHGFAILFFLFLSLLVVKELTNLSYCVICVSSSTTWLTLLIAYWIGWFESIVFIAVMAGMTAHGVYSLWEDNVKDQWLVFRLPLLVTLISVTYSFLSPGYMLEILGFNLLIWLLFSIVYYYRASERFDSYVGSIIKCCRDW